MKLKSWFYLGVILLLTLLMYGCGCVYIHPGYVGIKVHLLGAQKGIDNEVEPLDVGRHWEGIHEDIHKFPVFIQNYVWTQDKAEGSPNDESFTFQTEEGLEAGADVGISYALEKEKVPYIFQKYRKGVDEITDIVLRNSVRNAFNTVASKYKVEFVYGKGKEQLLREVEAMVKKEFAEQGILIDKLYWIGSIRLPKNVKEALDLKIEATQRAEQRENELREAEAEAKKKVIQAKAEAEANLQKLRTINNTLIQYEKVLNEKAAIEKWDGKLPNTMTGVVPFVDVGNK